MNEPASAPALPTRDQALALADRHAALSATRAGHDAHFAAESASLQAAADAVLGPIDAELSAIRDELEPWYAAHEAELTGGKRKSVEFGGCTLRYRTGNATVTHGEPDDDGAVFILRAAGLTHFVRSKPSLDKASLAKSIAGELDALALAKARKAPKREWPATPLTALGFHVGRSRTFVVEPTTASRQTTEVAA